MSALKDQLRDDLNTALKARDALRTSVIRMVLAAITKAEVAGKEARELSDDEVLDVLTSEAKKRRESASAFDEGNRPEMAAKEREEAKILAEYLPAALTDDEVAAIITDAIAKTGAATEGMKAMGKVMGIVTAATKGRADGSAVAAEVKRQLGA
ncbi:MAG TPA: GatB/YqeY domain-containing protein [Aeromicrobium sp.]|nr:GatB/YqeY domain-containing protein [Aeromicrobium sp.]